MLSPCCEEELIVKKILIIQIQNFTFYIHQLNAMIRAIPFIYGKYKAEMVVRLENALFSNFVGFITNRSCDSECVIFSYLS